MKKLLAAIIVALVSSAASASFIYDVNRIIGAGSVVGTITTDETLGAITSANILDWTFTLTSASLTSGSPHVISSASGGTIDPGTIEVPSGSLFATATALTWDFGASGNSQLLFWDVNFTHYYCLQTNGCFDFDGAGEAIGFGPNGSFGNYAEAVRYSTPEVIALDPKGGNVPEPTGLALVALGLVGVGLSRRKQR